MIPCLIPYEEDELFYSWLMRMIEVNLLTDSLARVIREWMNSDRYSQLGHFPKLNYDFKENVYFFGKNAGLSQDALYKVFFQS